MSASRPSCVARRRAGVGRPGAVARRTRRWLRTVRFYLPAVVVFVGGDRRSGSSSSARRTCRRSSCPQPTAIVAALQENWAAGRFALAPSAQATLIEAVGGLVIGTVAGRRRRRSLTARWLTARAALLPLAVAASAIPIIAFAPLMNNWFGVAQPALEDDDGRGARLLPGHGQRHPRPRPGRARRARADALVRRDASGRSCARSAIPNALPFFFTALKLGATLSLIGAIVGEYFGGSSLVLGRIIVQSASALRFDVTWAAILLGGGDRDRLLPRHRRRRASSSSRGTRRSGAAES